MNEKKVCLSHKDAVSICKLLAMADFEDRADIESAFSYVNAIYKEMLTDFFKEKKKS